MSGVTMIDEVVRSLEDCNRELRSLNSSTEDDFLAVGASLRGVLARAQEVSGMAASAADLMQSDELGGCIETLKGFFGEMQEYLDGSEERLGRSVQVLRSIMDETNKLRIPLSGFKRIVKHLRMLSVSMKIESARFSANESSFSNIADDVENLSTLIDGKSADILGAVNLLNNAISGTLSKVSALEAWKHEQARAILEKIVGSLSSLSEKHASSSVVAHDIAEGSKGVSRSVEEIVGLLQFHDITRQQIEHVIETFDDVCGKLTAPKTGEDEDAPLRDLHVGDICSLQMNQLSSAQHDLVSAINGTTDNLRNVMDNATDISRSISSLASTADRGAGSFLSRLKADMTRIEASLNDNVEANDRISGAVKGVAATIADLVIYVSAIEDIGVEIELIALNAQIKAARTGTEGAALGVLAEAVRSLSDGAREQTTPVSQALTHINDVAGSLNCSEKEEAGGVKAGLMADELNGLLNAFGQMDERIADLLTRMEKTGKDLEEDIRGLVSGITVHVRTEEALRKVIQSIGKTARLAGKGGAVPAGSRQSAYLKELEGRYTMHKERRVHRSSLHHRGEAVPVLPSDGSDGLGDNVELF